MTGSSPETALIEADPAETSQLDAQDTAVSSTANEGEGEKSLLDQVQETLSGAREQEQSPSSERDPADPAAPQAVEGAEKAPDATDPLGELTDEELKRYGPKTQRRIQQLLHKHTEERKKVEALEPKAKAFDQIDEFAKQNRLSHEEVGIILELGALIRNDKATAFERLTPIYRELAKATGAILPDDLQEKVSLGYLTREDAAELAKLRSTSQLTETKLKEQTEQTEQERRQQQTQTHVNECRTTANAWEAAKKGSDPDWNLKQDEIGRRLRLSVYENGYPDSQDKVVKLLDGILKEVNDSLARFRPKPARVQPVIGTASSRSNAEPKSALEAAELALGVRS
jgi:hypothetical protein